MNVLPPSLHEFIGHFGVFRGAFFCIAAMAAFLLLPERARQFVHGLPLPRIQYISAVLLAIVIAGAATYLLYPGQMDHAEPTITSLGQVLAGGRNLYPTPDYYPYHGLLYGPGLAMSQWLVADIPLPLLMASKLPAFIALLLAMILMWRMTRNAVARGYLLLLVPFAFLLFWNRAEPFLLLLVCLVLTFAGKLPAMWQRAVLVGLLAGIASTIKIHGAAYVLVAYLAVLPIPRPALNELLLLGATALTATLLPFLASGISLQGYLEYLGMGGTHGLDLRMAIENVFFFTMMLLPAVLVWQRIRFAIRWNWILILALETLVAILAMKIGSGCHHLIPFIPVHAYLLQQVCREHEVGEFPNLRMLYLCIAVPGSLAMLTFFMTMDSDWSTRSASRDELLELSARYDGLTMGVAGEDSYELSFHRIHLPAEQLDFAAYIDLALAGVQPETLAERMRTCAIPSMVLPHGGEPFSLTGYRDAPLFPDYIREQFRASYRKVEEGRFFAVFSCERPVTT